MGGRLRSVAHAKSYTARPNLVPAESPPATAVAVGERGNRSEAVEPVSEGRIDRITPVVALLFRREPVS
jgi:hypothetical protein